jgi:hypothetical protein
MPRTTIVAVCYDFIGREKNTIMYAVTVSQQHRQVKYLTVKKKKKNIVFSNIIFTVQ